MVDTVDQLAMSTAITETGPRLDAEGFQIAVAAPDATAVELCVPAADGRERRQPLERAGDLFTGRVDGAREGLRYGLRAHGPDCDPAVLLIDPLARAVHGRWSLRSPTVRPPRLRSAGRSATRSSTRRTCAAYPAPPRRAARVPRHLRRPRPPGGVDHLTRLGVTAVELLPVHEFATERACGDAACATTGATARSASSRRTPPTPRRSRGGGRSRSSARW